ncbi:recombinase RecA [Candidatus Kaiserbacteria bacterium RIFCSPLOWO2_12_FULL_53_8]|uniref:Protein RecA n=1 Tax=Candidatus Kaiserbacteria bacterium RIFCSPLOWO2_12_FULL_53_8 TaxID=1798529 RepID=A0A1F6G287_9BACT|nr:MAG: recombinase RecA [Candidatus Kaiserbacteria bacterium RIFCSPLOWO2_12_FULL_53_8]
MEKKSSAKPVSSPKSGNIQNALAEIEKQYGKGAIMKMGDAQAIEIERFSSGALSLDLALGGGIPKGRIIEIYGPESSGKTTLALHMVSEIQKIGGQAAFIDAEHALDVQYAKRIGVDIDNLLVSQPDDGESALEITETLVRSGGVDLIVIDSVAALTPRAEIEGMMGDSHMGLHARLMSQALRKLTAIVSKTSCSVIFINQMRMKIGVMFGNPETTTGGNALKFYSSLRLDVRRIDKIAEKGEGDQEIIGNRVRVKVVKNKVAPPFRQAEFDVIYNKGISREGDLIDLGLKHNVLTKSGAFLSFGENKMGQGREQAKEFLLEHPEIWKALEKEIRAKAAE